jgi:hypothetical protein
MSDDKPTIALDWAVEWQARRPPDLGSLAA